MKTMHEHLLARYEWYRNWHQNQSHSTVHWAFFMIVALSAFVYTNTFTQETETLLAATQLSETSTEISVVSDPEVLALGVDSEVVVSAVTQKTRTTLDTNSDGDKLIVTHATMSVSEWLKGSTDTTIEVDQVGGEMNGVKMRSSIEAEPLQAGETAVLFLQKQSNGHYTVTPGKSGNEQSVLRVKKDGSLIKGLTISQLRATLKK